MLQGHGMSDLNYSVIDAKPSDDFFFIVAVIDCLVNPW